MRVAEPIVLSEEVRRKLEQQSRGRSTQARVVLRSRIVLLAADGLQNKQIATALDVAPRMAALWRGRFIEHGIEGLLKDAPRSGRSESISRASLIEKTTQSTPANATHWSTRTMAREMGISKASVSRIWRASGLKPHRVESFKVSNDPNFADKLEAIVGLYLNPPEHALVLCVDEKSQIQALDRSQPGLPMKRFLRMIDQTIPASKQIYLICDNYATHKHARVQRWLQTHKRFHVRFTPTSASWLNMIERFFRDLTHNRIRRGVFQDLEQLITAIGDYIDAHNKNPKPFIWTAKANDILEKVTRAQTALNKRRSA